MRYLLSIITIVLISFGIVYGQEGNAYVTNQSGNSISVIDIEENEVVETISVGEEPRWIQISEDLSSVYVTNHLDNSVSKVSTETFEVEGVIPVGQGPCWLEFAEATNILSVANRDGGGISLIDTESDEVIEEFDFAAGASTNWGKALSSPQLAQELNRQGVIFLNEGTDNIALVDIPLDDGSPELAREIDTGSESAPRWTDVVFYPDSSLSLIAEGGTNEVSVLHYPSYELRTTIPVGESPYWLRITPDGQFAYVVNARGNTVSKISIADREEVARIPVGESPRFLAIDDQSARVYVANADADNVSVISVEDNEVITDIPVGTNPNWVALSPEGSKLLVANKGSDNVSVISTSNLEVIAEIQVGEDPNQVVTEPHEHVSVGTGQTEGVQELPAQYRLHQNYPNPFNPSTTVTYELPEATYVMLTVYDATGKKVADLVEKRQSAGKHTVTFDAAGFPSGVYLYRLETSDFTRVHKMMLIK
jgi:YVTN family beta-propeller protein